MTGDIDKIFQERFDLTDQQLILDYSKLFLPFSKIVNLQNQNISTLEMKISHSMKDIQNIKTFLFRNS